MTAAEHYVEDPDHFYLYLKLWLYHVQSSPTDT